MIKGQKIEVLIPPRTVKDTGSSEVILPAQIDMKNLRVTDLGNVIKRKGYAQKWDLTSEKNVPLLIPEDSGYAVDDNGSIYSLGDTVTAHASPIGKISRPYWTKLDDKIIVTAGSTPKKIVAGNSTDLLGNPAKAKWCAVVFDRLFLAGQDDNTCSYSGVGNPELFTGSFITDRSSPNKFMTSFRDNLFFFKERKLEVYSPTGASVPVVINRALGVEKGIKAPDSVVKTDDAIFWLGDDGEFWRYAGGGLTNISTHYRNELDKLQNPTAIYGFNNEVDKIIMWIAPTDGRVFIYDYDKELFFEDARWEGSGWQIMPINSYMELNGSQYFGTYNCDGLIYEMSKDSLDDAGQPIRALRHFKFMVANGERARVNLARFRFNRQVYTSAVTAPKMNVEWRFDNEPWENVDELTLGSAGEKEPYRALRQLGIGRELEMKLTEMDAVEFLATNLILTVEALN